MFVMQLHHLAVFHIQLAGVVVAQGFGATIVQQLQPGDGRPSSAPIVGAYPGKRRPFLVTYTDFDDLAGAEPEWIGILAAVSPDRKSGVEGKGVDLGGRRNNK